MASEVISVIVVAASVIVCVFAEPPVQIDQRHLQPNHDQEDNAGNGWQDSVPGLPGRDYPNLTSIPETSFSCTGKTPGGYYADVETRCQVFHVCSTNGAKSSFLCPSGSVFNQRHFVCDWWYDFICEQAPELYALNRGLDDRFEISSSTTSSSIDPSLQFNSIAGGDLSLASSGYPNNIRDDANLIYEDYAPVKADSQPTKEKFPSVAASSAPSANVRQLGDSSRATTSGIPVDNYFEPRRQDRLNSHRTRGRNHEEHRRPLTYRRRPIHGLDNVPRGFSKDRAAEELALAKGGKQGAGSFVNNGLADENERNKHFPLPRENNNYLDSSNNYNDKSNVDNGRQNNFDQNKNSNDFKGNTNDNYNSNNRFENYYQSTESNPLLQENSNRVNKNYKFNNNEANINYYNRNNANNDVQNNNYFNQNNFNNDNDENSNNNYYNKNNVNSNEYYNPGNNNINYENYNQKAEGVESSTVNSYSNNYDFPKDHQTRTPEASTSRPINSSPTEDDVDRERQREVDSADLKRKRPQPRHHQSHDNPSPAFLIREEFTANTWRDDLSTSSTASQNPPYPPDRNYLSPGSDTPTLSRPVEMTTPVASTTVSESKPRPQERPQFLGRRPAGGLPSGAGNGLPGANKVLIGSDAITNTPGDESAGTGDKNDGSVGTASAVDGNGVNGWDDQGSTYLPPQAYNEFGGDGQYNNWNNGGQTWNKGANFDRRY